MSYQDGASCRPSIISVDDDGTLISSRDSLNLTSGCDKPLVETLRGLEAENLSLRRALPRLKDMNGRDPIEEMVKICAKLAQTEEQLEEANNLCAEKHKQLECATQDFFRRAEELENMNRDTAERAQKLQDENDKLRQDVENDQSKIYHLIQQQNGEEMVSQADEMETIAALKQELDDRLTEIFELKRQADHWRTNFETRNGQLVDLQTRVDQQERAIEAMLLCEDVRKTMLGTRDGQSDGHPFSNGNAAACSDTDYIVANMFALLDLLDSNGREVKNLRQKVVELLQQHGYTANEANVTALSQTFVGEFSKQREVIKMRNHHLQNVIGTDSILQQHLDKLDDSSMTNNSMAAPAMTTFNDFVKNTSNVDFINRTMEMTQDLGTVRARMNALSAVCSQLFEKLRGTAEFLETVLETLDETEEGREILRKIQELKLDLDKSIHEAHFATSEFEKVEKSLMDYCDFMGEALDASCANFDHDPNASNAVASVHSSVLHNQSSVTPSANGSAIQDRSATVALSANGSAIQDRSAAVALSANASSIKERSAAFAPSAGDIEPSVVEELRKKLVAVEESYETLKNTLKNELQLKETLLQRIAELEATDVQNREELERLKDLLREEQKNVDKYQQMAAKQEAELQAKHAEIAQLEEKQKQVKQQPSKSIGKEIKGELNRIYESLAAAKETTSLLHVKKKASKK